MKTALLYSLLLVILLLGCSKDKIPPSTGNQYNDDENGWLVPLDQLLISQLPQDRIRSIDTPHFETLNSGNLEDNETVYVYRWGNTVKVYTQKILGGHEIVNDQIDDHHFAITYCPLTGSVVAWNRGINGQITEFGVSGHLYNENLIPYDRNSSSFWSQMLMQGIKGNHGGDYLTSEMLVSTKGGTIKKAFPEALVLIDSSGHVCNDSICISSNHKQDSEITNSGTKAIATSDLYGIINIGIVNGGDGALLFSYDLFNDSINVYNTYYRNSKVVVAGSKSLEFIIAFKDISGDPDNQFIPIQNSLPVIMKDVNGNHYDITGLVISGPSAGERLPASKGYSAHNFAWESFFGSSIVIFEK